MRSLYDRITGIVRIVREFAILTIPFSITPLYK
jgi:hypothetical protein